MQSYSSQLYERNIPSYINRNKKNTSFVVRTTSNIPCHSVDLRCCTSAAQIVSLHVYEPEYACHL